MEKMGTSEITTVTLESFHPCPCICHSQGPNPALSHCGRRAGHRQFWQPKESRPLWQETHFPGALSFFFFCFFLTWRDGRVMSRDFWILPLKYCESAKGSSQSFTTFPKCCPFLILFPKSFAYTVSGCLLPTCHSIREKCQMSLPSAMPGML